MGLLAKFTRISVEEYLAGEKVSEVRHEYVDGEIFAMAGESRRHNRIAGNIYGRLQSHPGNSDCDVFFESVKVQIAVLNSFYYPDVAVTCESGDDDEYVITSPRLVVEVLSPTTSATDLREKLFSYRHLKSLREYLILEQDSIRAILWRRGKRGQWSKQEISGDEELQLESVELSLKLSELYRGVKFPKSDQP